MVQTDWNVHVTVREMCQHQYQFTETCHTCYCSIEPSSLRVIVSLCVQTMVSHCLGYRWVLHHCDYSWPGTVMLTLLLFLYTPLTPWVRQHDHLACACLWLQHASPNVARLQGVYTIAEGEHALELTQQEVVVTQATYHTYHMRCEYGYRSHSTTS